MSTDKVRGRLDAGSESILFEGANMSELSILFKCDHRVLKEKMHGIAPCGKRGQALIYDISEVASRMGKLTEEQVDKAMRRLNHADLPKQLTKEYWAGKRSKQAYEREEGDLWPTARVVSEVGEMVKSLKMELDLLTDGIERNSEMTDRQREVAKQLVNGAKTNMLKRLKERFEDAEPVPVSVPIVTMVEDDDEL